MKKTFASLLPVIGVGLLMVLLYTFFKPIAFLLVSGIVLSVIYLLQAISFSSTGNMNAVAQNSLARVSVLILAGLFVLSLKVLHDYQHPSGDTPYFTNADHHAIQNVGVSFDDSITLYADQGSADGLWISPSGSLVMKGASSRAQLHSRDFFTPIFKVVKDKKRNEFLNPAWRTPVRNGFRISNQSTELRLTNFSQEADGEVEMDIVFTTDDQLLSPYGQFKDTFKINTSIKKGISLQHLFQQLDTSSAVEVDGVLYQWLNQVGDVMLIASTDNNLYLQPSAEMIKENYTCTAEGTPVGLTRNQQIDLQLNDHFYIGLTRSRYPLMMESRIGSVHEKLSDRAFLLRFEEQNLIPFFNAPNGERTIGQKYLRFLKNNYDLGDLSEVREGFMFQRNMKVNKATTVSGFLEFEVDKTGLPIRWSKSRVKEETGPGSFSLQSASGQHEWIYSIRDLSDNWFSFHVIKYYLFLIVLGMMILVVFFPSQRTMAIETPLLVIVYCFVVFRYLLIWRLATFPPLENIKKSELEDTMRQFDNILKDAPSSMTLLMVIGVLVIVALFRKLRIPDTFLRTNRPYRLTGYYLIFIATCAALALLPIEQLVRITRIALPLLGYLFFSLRAFRSNQSIPYETNLGGIGRKLVPFVRSYINTDMFFISLVTLMYFAVMDTGFAVIFFMFLLIRFCIFGISRINWSNVSLLKDILPLLPVLALLLTLLFYKGTMHFLLKNVLFLIALGSVIFAAIRYLLKPVLPQRWKVGLILGSMILAGASLLPYTGSRIGDVVNKKVRKIKYRAELIYQPMENVLFDNKFQSNQEAKILETAQSQWFIHSYLKGVTFLDDDKTKDLIRFRPHFKTGVDYSTQTRDVVLPRYIIAEFGGFTMTLLLVLCALPMLICLWMFRIISLNRATFLPDGATALMAMAFLFTIALMLWLTSTNRFVFFGQDFPFLSITSKVSVLIPLGLFATVLLTFPQQLNDREISIVGRVLPLIAFFLLIGFVISVSGKSDQITDDHFKVNFSKVETNVNERINELLAVAQEGMNLKLVKEEGLPTKDWTVEISKVVNRMYEDKRFLALYNDSLKTYEKSLWDMLRKDPSLGLKLNSPIHFKVDDGALRCVFNPYWSLELPPYDERKVWKGDVTQQFDLPAPDASVHLINQPDVKLIKIPYEYLRKPMDLAVLSMDNSIRSTGKAFVYDVKRKAIENAGGASYARLIDSSDIVFRANGGNISAFTVFGKDKRYFARNVLLNGKQQMIYPLGTSLFWARWWAQATKGLLEKTPDADLEKNTSLTLDYALTLEVGEYIETAVPRAVDKRIKDPAFSVIAADGDGKIRLMNDFVQLRKKIDPNNEPEIQEEQTRSYFYVDAAKERMQWGNLNLLRMTQGPGSSFKPILASAVISQVNAGWEFMNYKIKTQDSIFDFQNTGISYYAGERLRERWKGLKDSNKDADFRQYIINSNNLYHSLLVFLGSYSLEEIDKHGNEIKRLLKPYSGDRKAFPLIGVGGITYELPSVEDWPKSSHEGSYFAHDKSAMYQGLANNFGLKHDADNGMGRLTRKQNFSHNSDSVEINSTWAYPEHSYMLSSKRITIGDKKDNFNKAIRQTTLGGGGVFDVTPLKMAEMFGVLATTNPGYRLTIDDRRSTEGAFSNNQYSSFHYNTLLPAMKGVMESGGTASSLIGKMAHPEKNKYYYYGKTGTIGSDKGVARDKNSKRLGIIISKEPLTGASDTNKFYVIYFRFDNATLDGQIPSEIFQVFGTVLDKILRSSSFKNYMN